MFARVPVPWGPEPKSQVVSGLTVSTWVNYDAQPPKPQYFEDLFHSSFEIAVLIRNPPIPLALQKLALYEVPPDRRWAITRGIIEAYAPEPSKPQMAPLPFKVLSVLEQRAQEWRLEREREEVKPSKVHLQVSALPSHSQRVIFDPPVAGLKRAKRYRELSDIGSPTQVRAARVVMPSSLVRGSTDWKEMPPALAKWAVEKGISKASPPSKSRPVISALPSRRQLVLAALQNGEWVRVNELDIFPIRLRQWLEDNGVEFIRCFGWGIGGGAGAGTPLNGYVTEDGQIFYVAEDGATFYVQET